LLFARGKAEPNAIAQGLIQISPQALQMTSLTAMMLAGRPGCPGCMGRGLGGDDEKLICRRESGSQRIADPIRLPPPATRLGCGGGPGGAQGLLLVSRLPGGLQVGGACGAALLEYRPSVPRDLRDRRASARGKPGLAAFGLALADRRDAMFAVVSAGWADGGQPLRGGGRGWRRKPSDWGILG